MLDLTKPVTTRDGRSVRILATDVAIPTGFEKNGLDTLLGIVTEPNGGQGIYTWQADGTFLFRDRPDDADLINVAEARETYHLLSGISPGFADPAVAIEHAQHQDAMAVIKVVRRGQRVDTVEAVYARS